PCSIPLPVTPPPPSAIHSLSLHDALPICRRERDHRQVCEDNPGISEFAARAQKATAARFCVSNDCNQGKTKDGEWSRYRGNRGRSEEHTSELQSRFDLVCRLLLEKKKKNE